MLRLSKRVLLATALLTCSTPALAHPGHGPDNPILHRVVHWASGVDPAWAALFASVLALALVAGLWVRSRRSDGRFPLLRRHPL